MRLLVLLLKGLSLDNQLLPPLHPAFLQQLLHLARLHQLVHSVKLRRLCLLAGSASAPRSDKRLHQRAGSTNSQPPVDLDNLPHRPVRLLKTQRLGNRLSLAQLLQLVVLATPKDRVHSANLLLLLLVGLGRSQHLARLLLLQLQALAVWELQVVLVDQAGSRAQVPHKEGA